MRRVILLYLECQLVVIYPTHSAPPPGEGVCTLSAQIYGPSAWLCSLWKTHTDGNTYRFKAERRRGEEETVLMAAYKLAWDLRKN